MHTSNEVDTVIPFIVKKKKKKNNPGVERVSN